MELETINKLFLELSQIATAKTAREIEALKAAKIQCAEICERRSTEHKLASEACVSLEERILILAKSEESARCATEILSSFINKP